MCGCLVENPAYDGPATSEGTGEASAAGTSTTTTTTGTSVAATTGPDEPTTTTTGTDASASESEATTAGPMSATLHHYDPARCLEPLWCFANPDVWSGLPGEVRGAECYFAPAAPYRVRRIDYALVAAREQPKIRFEVRSGDLSQVLYTSEALVLPVGQGSLEIPEDDQPVVDGGRFCVTFTGGDPGSTVGFGVDAMAPPGPFQSFFGADACEVPGLRDVNLFTPEIVPHGVWCLGAELAEL